MRFESESKIKVQNWKYFIVCVKNTSSFFLNLEFKLQSLQWCSFEDKDQLGVYFYSKISSKKICF
jgi:hypothetical protein